MTRLRDRFKWGAGVTLADIAADTELPIGAYRDIAHKLGKLIETSKDADVIKALYERARTAGDLKWAILLGRRLEVLAPSAQTRLMQVRDLISADHYGDAAAIFATIQPSDVSMAEFKRTQFLLDLTLGQFDTIEEDLVEVRRLLPDLARDAENRMIQRLIEAGHYGRAGEVVARGMAHSPAEPYILLSHVRLTLIHEGPSAALSALQALSDQIAPDSETYRTTYAGLLIDWGRFNEAADLLFGWIEATPRVIGYYWLAMLAASQCDRTTALTDLLDDVMARYPDIDGLADARAALAVDQNDWALAAHLFGKADAMNQWAYDTNLFAMALQRPNETNPDTAYASLAADGVRYSGPAIMLSLFNYYYRATPEHISFSLDEIEPHLGNHMADPGFLAIYMRLLIADNSDGDAQDMYAKLPLGLRRCAPLAPFEMFFDAQAGRHEQAAKGWAVHLADTAHMALNARSSLPETIHLKYRETPKDVLLFSTIFNGIEFVDWFLDYYRALGVDHFFFVDNGSTDGTFEHLAAQPDVSLFANEGSFSASACGVFWTNHLMRRFGVGHWCFHVDMDEAFVFPHDDQGRSLHDFLAYLDQTGCQSVPSLMLDIYPRRLSASASENTFAASTFIDCDYRFVRNEIPPYQFIQGGIRARMSGRSLLMTKVPLVKMTPDLAYISNNHQHSHAVFSPVTSALLHYKFVGDFSGRIDEAIERKQHFMGGRFYRSLKEGFDGAAKDGAGQNGAELFSEFSVHYRNSAQLIDLGLITSHKSWDEFDPKRP